MTQIDELKKWLNEIEEHYKALREMKSLTSYDQAYWDTYKTVQSKITEIEGIKAKVFSSNAVLAVTSDSKENKKGEVAVCEYDEHEWKEKENYLECQKCGKWKD